MKQELVQMQQSCDQMGWMLKQVSTVMIPVETTTHRCTTRLCVESRDHLPCHRQDLALLREVAVA